MDRRIRRWCGFACLVAWLGAGPSATMAEVRPRQPLWELGVFTLGVSQQAYPGAGQQVERALVLPFFVYRGDILRADGRTAGLVAVSTPRFELDLGVAGSFGSSSGDIDARRGMPDLGTLVEFGPRARWNIGAGVGGGRWRLELPLRSVLDLSAGLARRGVVFEPKVIFERQARGGWLYSTSVGAIAGDRRFADTLYGVAPIYATVDRPAYAADSGLIGWRIATGFSRRLTSDWRLFGIARMDSVDGSANRDSPLVLRRLGASIGIGITYTWRRSTRSAPD